MTAYSAPAYMSVLPREIAQPNNAEEFLYALTRRLGALQKGGLPDLERAERWFIHWWRNGGSVSTPSPFGWGLDFDFTPLLVGGALPPTKDQAEKLIERIVDDYVASISSEEGVNRLSLRQEKKAAREAKIKARAQRRSGVSE